VINYSAFFEVSFEKKYFPGYDNVTLFNFVESTAKVQNATVIAFYGMDNQNLNRFKLNETYFSKISNFDDGTGLYVIQGRFLNIACIYFIFLFLIYI
jgi:uncharacterized protein (DUF1684 family)